MSRCENYFFFLNTPFTFPKVLFAAFFTLSAALWGSASGWSSEAGSETDGAALLTTCSGWAGFPANPLKYSFKRSSSFLLPDVVLTLPLCFPCALLLRVISIGSCVLASSCITTLYISVLPYSLSSLLLRLNVSLLSCSSEFQSKDLHLPPPSNRVSCFVLSHVVRYNLYRVIAPEQTKTLPLQKRQLS